MKRVLYATILGIVLGLSILNGNGTSGENLDYKKLKIFLKQDDGIISSSCKWECRDTNSNYFTQITGFDFKTGKTFCKVFHKNDMNQDLGIEAGQTNIQCALKADVVAEYNRLVGNGKMDISNQSSIEFKENESQITLSKFLVALVTLNPDIIDRSQTQLTGQIAFRDGKSVAEVSTITRNHSGIFGVVGDSLMGSIDIFQKIAGKEINPITTNVTTYEKTSALDGFNKNNMAYFSDLFLEMEKIYQHLQIFIFILVGGFFVTQIGANKLQAYLENRGESGGKQPYLHKFYIPILMVGTFFMPIPEANAQAHSTIMQNMIRYFAIHSTNLADMASAIGGKTYMNKIYKSVGSLNPDGVRAMLENIELQKHIITEGNKIYKKTCMERYDEKLGSYNVGGINFLTLSEEDKQDFRKAYNMDINQVSGTKNDISFESCIALEVKIRDAQKALAVYENQKKGFENFKNKVSEKITQIDKYFSARETQLGWLNSVMTPSSAILAEIFTLADDIVVENNMKESTKSNKKNTMGAIHNGDTSMADDDIGESYMGVLSGNLVWMMLPGASAIKDFIRDSGSLVPTWISSLARIPIGLSSLLGIASTIFDSAKSIIAYYSTIVLMQWTFEKVPLLVCTTASLVAFVSYLVSLCKYFYISPFVVAFSMATKRMDKIIDFLITGISIFLRPVLIILFIYLALFLHTIINELFLFLSAEQFSGIETSFYNFYTNFIIGAITGLLVIFGTLASSYIMWKLIVSGAGWALSLIGIDGRHDDAIAGALEQKLAQRAFIA